MDPCSSSGLRFYKASSQLPTSLWPCCLWWMCQMWVCAVMKDTRLSGGMASPRYPHRSQTLVLFNVSTALRSLLIASFNPPACKKHVRHTHFAVIKLCVCAVQSRFAWLSSHPGCHSHTGLQTRTCCQATRTLITPKAARYQHCALRRDDEEFGDISKLTEIDWQFIPSVTVKNHLLKIAHFSTRSLRDFLPEWLSLLLLLTEQKCGSFLHRQANNNPSDQQATV